MVTPDYSVNEAVLLKIGNGVYQGTIVSNARGAYTVVYPGSRSVAVVHRDVFDGSVC